MTKEELRIRRLVLGKFLHFFDEMQEAIEEIQKLITISTDHGEIRRLQRRFNQIHQITKNTHVLFDSIYEEHRLHLVEQKK